MANQRTDTQAVVNLVINGQQAMTSLRELTDTQRRLNTEMRNMRPGDPGYRERLRELQMVNRAMAEQRREVQGLNTESSKLKLNWKEIAGGIAGGFGISAGLGLLKSFGAEVFETTAKFQRLEAVLTTTLGSKSGAQLAMKNLARFAAETPFAVDELTESYVKLANRGFKPSIEQLRQLGDLAASTGKSFDQLAEAQLDAETGEFERLKEFGIRAEKNGDKVRFTFKGITEEVDFTSSSIRNYITSLGDAEGVSGSMAGVSETLSGKVSNLGDNWDGMLKIVGEGTSGVFSGAIDIMNEAVSSLSQYMNDLNIAQKYNAPGTGTWERIGSALSSASVGGMGYNKAAIQRNAFASVSNGLDEQIGDAKYFRQLYEVQGDLLSRMKAIDRTTQEGAASYQLYADKLKMIKDRSNEIATDREREKLTQQSDAAKKVADEQKKLAKEAERLAAAEKQKAIKEFESLDDQYKKINLERLNDQLSTNEKEVKQEGDKFDALLAKEREFLSMKGTTPKQRSATLGNIEQIESDKSKAVADLRVRQQADMVQKIKDLNIQLSAVHESELEKQKVSINKYYDELEKNNAGNTSAITHLKVEREKTIGLAVKKAKEALQKDLDKVETKLDPVTETEKLQLKLREIGDAYDAEKALLKDKYSTNLEMAEEYQAALAIIEGREREAKKVAVDAFNKKSNEDLANAIISSTETVANATFQIISNNMRAQSEHKINKLQEERDAELSTKNLTEADKERINKRYDDKIKQEKAKAWRAEKAAALAQAIINGALAVSKVIAQTGVLSPFAIPAVAIATAAQIAVILSQKPPEFAKGVRDFEGGPAVVGEKGKELVNENGKWWLTQGPQLANLESGTDVYNANETSKILSERLYPKMQYSLDINAAQNAERNYRSGGMAKEITSALAGNAQSNPAPVVNIDLDSLNKKLDDVILAIDQGIVFDYSRFEKYEKRIEYDRKSQGG